MDFIEERFSKLYGYYSWGVTLGYNTILHFDFGEPILKIGRTFMSEAQVGPLDSDRKMIKNRQVYVHGQWRLSIFADEWSIRFNDQMEITTDRDKISIQRVLSSLSGQKLTSVSTLNDGGTNFTFDLEYISAKANFDEAEWSPYNRKC